MSASHGTRHLTSPSLLPSPHPPASQGQDVKQEARPTGRRPTRSSTGGKGSEELMYEGASAGGRSSGGSRSRGKQSLDGEEEDDDEEEEDDNENDNDRRGSAAARRGNSRSVPRPSKGCGLLRRCRRQ
jgi:hypothetical protein